MVSSDEGFESIFNAGLKREFVYPTWAVCTMGEQRCRLGGGKCCEMRQFGACYVHNG